MMKPNAEERAEQLLNNAGSMQREEMSAGLEERVWSRIQQEHKPAGIVRTLSEYTTPLLAAASVAALLNIAYLLHHNAQEKKEKADTASMFIDTYQLDELNNNL